MKKISELMQQMGFNTHAPAATKEAFLKHLIKQSLGASVRTPSEKKIIEANPHTIIQFPQQLSFELDEVDKQTDLKKKASHN